MKTKLSALVLLLLPFYVYCQAPASSEKAFSISTPYQVVKATKRFYFSDSTHLIAIKSNFKKVTVQLMDAQTQQVLSVKEYTDFPHAFVVDTVLQMRQRIYMLYSYRNRAEDHEKLFAREVDFSTGALKEPQLILDHNKRIQGFDVPGPGIFGKYSPRTINKYEISASYDDSRLLVKYVLRNRVFFEKNDYKKVGLMVFNPAMKRLWHQELDMPYSEKKMDFMDAGVDGKGNAYILARVYNDNTKREKKHGELNYHLELLRIRENTTNIEISEVGLENKFIATIHLQETSGEQMVCAGYYNHDNKWGNAAGLFMFRAEIDGLISDPFFYPIPRDVVVQYTKANDDDKPSSDRDVSKLKKKPAARRGASSRKPVRKMPTLAERTGQVVRSTPYKPSTPDKKSKPKKTAVNTKDTSAKKTKKKGSQNNSEGVEEDGIDLANMKLREIHAMEDGGIIAIGEQYYVVTYTDARNKTVSTVYNYGSVVALRVDSTGALAWARKVPKLQVSAAPPGSVGYKYLSDGKTHYIVYLDHVKNLDLSTSKRPYKYLDRKDGVLVVAKIDDMAGEMLREQVLDVDNADGIQIRQFGVDRVLPVTDDFFVFEAYKKKKEDVLVKVNVRKKEPVKKLNFQ